jgi:hypothetical protein
MTAYILCSAYILILNYVPLLYTSVLSIYVAMMKPRLHHVTVVLVWSKK